MGGAGSAWGLNCGSIQVAGRPPGYEVGVAPMRWGSSGVWGLGSSRQREGLAALPPGEPELTVSRLQETQSPSRIHAADILWSASSELRCSGPGLWWCQERSKCPQRGQLPAELRARQSSTSAGRARGEHPGVPGLQASPGEGVGSFPDSSSGDSMVLTSVFHVSLEGSLRIQVGQVAGALESGFGEAA